MELPTIVAIRTSPKTAQDEEGNRLNFRHPKSSFTRLKPNSSRNASQCLSSSLHECRTTQASRQRESLMSSTRTKSRDKLEEKQSQKGRLCDTKSPSKTRIEKFMEDLKARERQLTKCNSAHSENTCQYSSTRRTTGHMSSKGHMCLCAKGHFREENSKQQTESRVFTHCEDSGVHPSMELGRATSSESTITPTNRLESTTGERSSPKPSILEKKYPSTSTAGLQTLPPFRLDKAQTNSSVLQCSPITHPNTTDDSDFPFAAIHQHDWLTVELYLQSYDYKKYLKPTTSSLKTRRPQRKLRLFKFLPSMESKKTPTSRKWKPCDEEFSPPLMRTDSSGRTPLHLACKEFMPFKLLQKLYFLERKASTIMDHDGRLPLHIAALVGHDNSVMDQLIRANPPGLQMADSLKRTPLAYAILRAEHKRKKCDNMMWATPLCRLGSDWQTQQCKNWEKVSFILETFVTRRQLLSTLYERSLLLDATKYVAPPSVLSALLSLSTQIIRQNTVLAGKLLHFLFRYQYPISVFEKFLRICLESVPASEWKTGVRNGMMKLYGAGKKEFQRENFSSNLSFQSELLQAYKRHPLGQDKVLSVACQEWWNKLKFFIGFSSSGTLKGHMLDETSLLHSSLCIPSVPLSLIELLVRMFPSARYERDTETDALPIHIACKRNLEGDTRTDKFPCQLLQLLVEGDSELAKMQHQGLYPLHIAILAGQSTPFIGKLVSWHPNALRYADPRTKLYPFQLAALAGDAAEGSSSNEIKQLDLIFRLLRTDPFAVPTGSTYEATLNQWQHMS